MKPRADPGDIVAAGYDELGDRFERWAAMVHDPVRDRLFDQLFERLPDRAPVLDVGCGSGIPWTARLAERFEVTGIDISPRQVEAARRAVPRATVLVGDIVRAEFPAASFDGAVALYSVGHLPAAAQEPVLGRLAGWLRPGGLLLASLPATREVGWTGPWIDGVEMFFASLGAARYHEILDRQGWRLLEAIDGIVREPEGPARFLWVLAQAPVLGRAGPPGAEAAPPGSVSRRASARR